MWALDAQTHGESAALNEDVMADENWEMTMEDCAEACVNLYNFYIAPGQRPHDRVIYIGHSAGSVCALLSTSLFRDRAPYDACILVEPAMWTEDLVGQNSPFFDMAILSLPKRREHWKSWEEMRNYIRARMPWNTWDKRALDLYLKFAFKNDERRGGVTLKCSPKQEATPFKNIALVADVVKVLDKTCKYMPIHLVYGENNDLVTEEQQASLLRDGRTFASITRIPGCGHMVVQEDPEAVTKVIWDILVDNSNPIPKHKL
ncbi:alpha/beta-hydrolase [Cylindrobasidium torrendii FP15055 ss-10]|uniref:Alpha/beta-hydrolase n=1 Tax=Cylindrobasidium torrendii FP15055 ss-10 TaxID=1314674 RepID=A0A0D7BNF5_9AGAR|nr:alpha/beta-hydrolase [Cylindrobasidium torrendii FP15055 ss-10]